MRTPDELRWRDSGTSPSSSCSCGFFSLRGVDRIIRLPFCDAPLPPGSRPSSRVRTAGRTDQNQASLRVYVLQRFASAKRRAAGGVEDQFLIASPLFAQSSKVI